MASLQILKPRLQHWLRPTADRLAGLGVTPNMVTGTALGLSLAYGVVLTATAGAPAALLGLPAVMAVRLGLNAIDGMIAREHGQASVAGAYLNELGDVVADAALYLPFALVLAGGWMVVPAVICGILAEFAGVLAATQTGTRRYDGPFGKGDRSALFAILAVVQATIPIPSAAVVLVFVAATFLSLATILNRLKTERFDD